MNEIKAACVEAVWEVFGGNGAVEGQPELIVNAVLDTILALTPSPRTVDELTRIRGAGPD